MFFIVNHENSIIAADADFLEGVGAEDIYEAALLIKKGEVVLDELEQSITYFQKSNAFSKTRLSTFLGDAYLYMINEEISQDSEEDKEQKVVPDNKAPEEALFNLAIPQAGMMTDDIREEEEGTAAIDKTEFLTEEIFSLSEHNEEDISLEDTPLTLSEPEETTNDLLHADTADIQELELLDISKEEVSQEPMDISEEIIGLLDTDSKADNLVKESAEDPEEEKLNLTITDEPVLSIMEDKRREDLEEISAASILNEIPPILSPEADLSQKQEEEKEAANSTETPGNTLANLNQTRVTDFKEIAELIGVSEEEYLHFLEDFENESIQLEPNLKSNDLRESREALSILKEASLLLHLPQITEKLNGLSRATSDEKSSLVDSFLTLVTQIRNVPPTAVPDDSASIPNPLFDLSDNTVEHPSLQEKDIEGERLEPILDDAVKNLTEQTSAALDQVQPIPFDFSLNEAADELTLPASLVSEFVIDFISQAKENLPLLQKAYEERDMDTIETTAHMLKGASSNLRITPIAETLYQLQFNQDFAQVPELLTLFAGQLKALSIQMDQV